jgi:hypothetical protein
LPSQIYIDNFLIANVYNGNSSTPNTVNPRIITGTNQISITPYVSSIITNTQIVLTNLYFLQPVTTTAPTFSLRRSTHQYSYSSCCNLTLNYSQSLTIQAVTLTSYTLKAASDYLITFVPTYHGIYYIIADFGSAFSFTVSTIYPCYLSTLTNSAQMICTAISATQIQATLTNTSASFASFIGFASNYTLIMTSLTNPSQVNATITISTYYLPANMLEYSNSFTIAYLTSLILDATVTPSSVIVGDTTSYTFTVNNTNSLLPNSILHIYFPTSFSLSGISCTTNAVSSSCNMSSSTYIQFTLPNAIIAPYSLPTYTLTVLNVINPNSLQPTASFGLALQSGNSVVEAIYDGVVVVMTTLAHFTSSSLLVTPNSYTVGNLASYTINFAHSLSISSSSVITLSFQLPSQLTLVACSACSSY